MPDERAPLSDFFKEPPPVSPTPEERSYGAELLKRRRWEDLGVDYSQGYGALGYLYDDTPTQQEVRRQRAAGHPTIGDLQDRSIEMEQKLQRPPGPLWQPRMEQIQYQLEPVKHNPHNPAPVTLESYEGGDPHNPKVELHRTDEDPWAKAGTGQAKAAQQPQTTEAERREILNNLVRQSDPYTAAPPPAEFHDPLGPKITKAATDFFGGPGRAAAPNPYPPGSEEHEFYEQSRSSGMSQWGAETARQMVGSGTSFAQRGALGVAGGRPFHELSLDEQLAKLHEINRGLQQDVADASHFLPQQPPVPERETGLAAAYRHARPTVEHEFGNYYTPGHPDVEPASRLFQVQHPEAPSHFNEHILPHYGSEQEFADHYFAGHHSPEIEMDRVGNMLEFGGVLRNENGKMVGTISRQIDPVEGTAHHGYLRLDPSLQGSGLAKTLLGNQMDLYQRMGLKSVDLFADIDVGSYAWAKYGFLPGHQGEWNAVKQVALRRLSDPHIGGKLEHEDYQAVRQILQRSDPEAIWDLADMKLKLPSGEPVAKRLLFNNSWNGKLDLNNPEAMERFNGYVKK